MTSTTPLQKHPVLEWEEIITTFPDEWVFIADPVMDGINITRGIIVAHHKDKRIASIEGGTQKGSFQKFTFRFTGKTKPTRRIGILKNIKQREA